MSTHRLSFARIILHREDIAEVVVDEGAELTVPMVAELHGFWLTNLEHPFSVIINRANSYGIETDAIPLLGSLEQLNAIAVVAREDTKRTTVEILSSYPREYPWNHQIFSTMKAAVAWVTAQQDSCRILH